jgi:hypothetical protein
MFQGMNFVLRKNNTDIGIWEHVEELTIFRNFTTNHTGASIHPWTLGSISG